MTDLKLELVLDSGRGRRSGEGVLHREAGLRAGRRPSAERGLPRRADDPARLGLLDHDRHRASRTRSRARTEARISSSGTSRRRGRSSSGAAWRSATSGTSTARRASGGPAPTRSTAHYASFADFADPDGNTWVLQEVRKAASRELCGAGRNRLVGEEWHRDARVAADEDGARDRGRAVAVAHPVERCVERVGRQSSRERELDRSASSRFVSEIPTSVIPRSRSAASRPRGGCEPHRGSSCD